MDIALFCFLFFFGGGGLAGGLALNHPEKYSLKGIKEKHPTTNEKKMASSPNGFRLFVTVCAN